MGLGYIESERLQNIPVKHHQEHELCFYLHDCMVALLKSAENERIDVVNFPLTPEEEKELSNSDHVFDFLLSAGRRDVMKRIIVNRTSIVLYADMLHFLHDALVALEKRKYAVAFTLLRKPLKQNMLFASWMLADEDDFYNSIESHPHEHMEERQLSLKRRLEIFHKCLEETDTHDFFDKDHINALVYDKSQEAGFANLV